MNSSSSNIEAFLSGGGVTAVLYAIFRGVQGILREKFEGETKHKELDNSSEVSKEELELRRDAQDWEQLMALVGELRTIMLEEREFFLQERKHYQEETKLLRARVLDLETRLNKVEKKV